MKHKYSLLVCVTEPHTMSYIWCKLKKNMYADVADSYNRSIGVVDSCNKSVYIVDSWSRCIHMADSTNMSLCRRQSQNPTTYLLALQIHTTCLYWWLTQRIYVTDSENTSACTLDSKAVCVVESHIRSLCYSVIHYVLLVLYIHAVCATVLLTGATCLHFILFASFKLSVKDTCKKSFPLSRKASISKRLLVKDGTCVYCPFSLLGFLSGLHLSV